MRKFYPQIQRTPTLTRTSYMYTIQGCVIKVKAGLLYFTGSSKYVSMVWNGIIYQVWYKYL